MDEFKVGDKVSWCGAHGVITKIYDYKSELAAPILVDFGTLGPDGRVSVTQTFLKDGRLYPWHLEVSLKKVENGS